jgi:hypothetical protein
VEKFTLTKLNELEFKKQYYRKTSNRFATLEYSKDSQDINRTWENIKENIKTSAKESLGVYKLKPNINHGLMKNGQTFSIEVSRLKCCECRTQTKTM